MAKGFVVFAILVIFVISRGPVPVSAPMMTIRDLTTLADCLRVVALEKEVWNYTDGEDVVPAAVLIVSVKRGGILLGAFDDRSEMVGFVYSMAAIRDGRPTQWSHMLGVRPAARGTGLGLRLKIEQRARAIAQNIDLIEWTFDPLMAVNAHLNIARLGAVVEEYEENIYGESSSPLHRGSPTDRFVAEWRLNTPHVERRISAPSFPAMRDATIASAPLVNPSIDGDPWLKPSPAPDLSIDARRVLVEIPTGFADLQQADPALALEWRLSTRRIFQHYLSRGYRVVDFMLSAESRRGRYVIAQSLVPSP
jgi:predicted GNAT superfamily acetyltransferase